MIKIVFRCRRCDHTADISLEVVDHDDLPGLAGAARDDLRLCGWTFDCYGEHCPVHATSPESDAAA